MKPITLDIETGAVDKSMTDHAGLEPWRLRHGTARIDSIAIQYEDQTSKQIINHGQPEWKQQVYDLLCTVRGKRVFCHNAIFDVAWLIAEMQPDRTGPIPDIIRDIDWRCTMLLTRWLINGQVAEVSRFSYSLANICKTFMPDHPRLEEFLTVKDNKQIAGENAEYWEQRGLLDVIMTQDIAEFLRDRLPVEQRIGYNTECECIAPVANSWIMGIRIDKDQLSMVEKKYNDRIDVITGQLGVPRTVISSPKQLGSLLFDRWSLPVKTRTTSGAPSTAKDVLMWTQYDLLQHNDTNAAESLGLILEAKTLLTLLSKYVKTTREALAHTTDGFIYGAPRIFGTYTGRFTYSNSTLKKYKTGIALHQMPRKAKEIRAMLLPPEGMIVYEADAAGQESRLMAIRSGDETMLKIFSSGMNFHSMTGASIIGKDYDEFEECRSKEHGEGYFTEQRQLGKLTNLSCNYRIGGKALSEKSFVNYDTYMTIEMGKFLVNTFIRTYPKVADYWDDVVWEAKEKGYTECFGGRRYKLSNWRSHRWLTESSAINTPIQGAGASMKEIAIGEMYRKVQHAMFSLDLHDASFMFIREDVAEETVKALDYLLNNIKYEPYWGFETPIPLEYESAHGRNFSDVK